MNRRLGRCYAALWLVIFMLATACNVSYAAEYGYSLANTTATVQTPTVPLQSGTWGSSTVSNYVYATVSVTESAILPITLTNCASCSATPNPFQVLIQPNPSYYSAYEASDLGNIEFCSNTSCNTVLNSWLEGCGNSATTATGSCSTSSKVASFWVKLTSTIPSNGGTLTIYMVFLPTSTEFDRLHRGEAPQLSSSYGLYDNGANVFDLYFNGTTALTRFSLGAANAVAHTTGVANPAGGSTITVISLTGTNNVGENRVNMLLTTPLPNTKYGEIAESYSEIMSSTYTGNAQGLAGFCDSNTASSTENAESEDVGYGSHLHTYLYDAGGSSYFVNAGGSDAATTWYYAALAYPGNTSTSFSGNVSTTFYESYVTPAAYHPITGSAQLYWCSVGSYLSGNPDGLYFDWGRARVSPPSNSGGTPTMPSASFGSIASAANGVILTFRNSGSSSWLANLAVVGTPTNTARLTNLTVSFTSPLSKQVILGTGVTNQNSGPQVTLAGGATLSIIVGVAVSSSGTSTVTLGLKIQIPPSSGSTSVYCYDIIVLTVN